MGSTRTFDLGRKLLFGLLIGMVGFGIALVFFDNRFPGPLHAAINESIWRRPDLPADVVLYHRFVHAVLGATIASWALALVFVVRHALAAREPWAWWCVLCSTLIWFVPDTAASLYFGVWPNAVFNVVCLGSFAVPLALTRSVLSR